MTITPGVGVTREDIESVQAAQEEMMPEFVRIYADTLTADSRGGTKTTFAELPYPASPVIGRIGGVRDNIRVAFAGQLRGKAAAVLTVPFGTPLEEQNKVHVFGGQWVPVGTVVAPMQPTGILGTDAAGAPVELGETYSLGDHYIVANLAESSYSTAGRYLIMEV